MKRPLFSLAAPFAYVIVVAYFIAPNTAFCQDHIRDLDSVRNSMTEYGNVMPGLIKSSQGPDIRTLERLFEINTYALTTIEAYFKMVKLIVTAEGPISKEIIDVLNNWLDFINRFCKKDIQYLDEAMSETSQPYVLDMIKKAKQNVMKLDKVTVNAIEENRDLLR